MNPLTETRARVRRNQAQSLYEGSDYRAAISILHTAQCDIECVTGRTSEWWNLRAVEAHNHRMRGDHESCIAVALSALVKGNEIRVHDRMRCEIDLLASCIETRPRAQTEGLMAEIFSHECFDDNARGACYMHYTRGLLAQRRGDLRRAYSHFTRSWDIRRQGHFSGYTRMVHLVKCAEMAVSLAEPKEVTRWIGTMENTGYEIPCDEVRLRYAQVLALRLEPPTAALAATIRELAYGGLRLIEARPEKIHYWNYILGLLYGLAIAGDVPGARRYTAFLPDWPPFERSLWEADLAWFAFTAANGVSLPALAPTLSRGDTKYAEALPAAASAELQSGYRAAWTDAVAADARLTCSWRTNLLTTRLAHLGGQP